MLIVEKTNTSKSLMDFHSFKLTMEKASHPISAAAIAINFLVMLVLVCPAQKKLFFPVKLVEKLPWLFVDVHLEFRMQKKKAFRHQSQFGRLIS